MRGTDRHSGRRAPPATIETFFLFSFIFCFCFLFALLGVQKHFRVWAAMRRWRMRWTINTSFLAECFTPIYLIRVRAFTLLKCCWTLIPTREILFSLQTHRLTPLHAATCVRVCSFVVVNTHRTKNTNKKKLCLPATPRTAKELTAHRDWVFINRRCRSSWCCNPQHNFFVVFVFRLHQMKWNGKRSTPSGIIGSVYVRHRRGGMGTVAADNGASFHIHMARELCYLGAINANGALCSVCTM